MSEMTGKDLHDLRARKSVLRQLAALEQMGLEDLKDKWIDLFGTDPPGYKKQFLIKRLAYRIQELFYGGLSQEVRGLLTDLAEKDPAARISSMKPVKQRSKNAILPGTRFVRIWRDRRYEVIARENGFEYEGRMFRSLTAVAREITGTNWNGRVFFGLKKAG